MTPLFFRSDFETRRADSTWLHVPGALLHVRLGHSTTLGNLFEADPRRVAGGRGFKIGGTDTDVLSEDVSLLRGSPRGTEDVSVC